MPEKVWMPSILPQHIRMMMPLKIRMNIQKKMQMKVQMQMQMCSLMPESMIDFQTISEFLRMILVWLS
jgi:hypothetical protein